MMKSTNEKICEEKSKTFNVIFSFFSKSFFIMPFFLKK